MDWNTILSFGAAVIVSFGGAGAIVIAVTKFCVNQITENLQKKYELKLSKELEQFKSALVSKSYVSKTRFDAEFTIYRELSRITVTMVVEVSQLFPVFTRDMRDDYDTYKERYDTALEKVIEFQNKLAANAPFISSETYKSFHDLEMKCKAQLSDFVDFRLRPDAKIFIAECREEYNEVWKRTREIQADLENIIEQLRGYLSRLEVL